jgi:egghead protein (zeste-white 4 protein)
MSDRGHGVESAAIQHRGRVIIYFLIGMILLAAIQSHLGPGRIPVYDWEYYWKYGYVLWVPSLVPSLIGIIGLCVYAPGKNPGAAKPITYPVVYRIVSKGENKKLLTETIDACLGSMERDPLFVAAIEVIVESQSGFEYKANPSVRVISVPSEYETTHSSKFKARALQYALTTSGQADDCWAIYLDEETQPLSSGIHGIASMISDEEESGRLRVGQGAILYNRNFSKFPLLFLADTLRTADDFGRFHLQHLMGRPIFGLHGSFIVARNDIVKRSGGFDVGPRGHLTEDAWWAMVLIQKGFRTRWIDGFLQEQSTQSVSDFSRQRARWFVGNTLTAWFAPAKILYRLPFLFLVTAWAITAAYFIFSAMNIFVGSRPPAPMQILFNLMFAYIATAYLVGLHANLKEAGVKGFWRLCKWNLALIGLLPIIAMLEALGVLRGIFLRQNGFHVVKK